MRCVGPAERTPSRFHERCLGVRCRERGGSARVDAFRQFRDGSGPFSIEQPTVALGCGRQARGHQVREHVHSGQTRSIKPASSVLPSSAMPTAPDDSNHAWTCIRSRPRGRPVNCETNAPIGSASQPCRMSCSAWVVGDRTLDLSLQSHCPPPRQRLVHPATEASRSSRPWAWSLVANAPASNAGRLSRRWAAACRVRRSLAAPGGVGSAHPGHQLVRPGPITPVR